MLTHRESPYNTPKAGARTADKHIKSKMLPGLTTVSLPQIYCKACHLSTRADLVRCLHCNRLLNPPATLAKRALRKAKPARRVN